MRRTLHHSLNDRPARRRAASSGFSIIELLVALIIIGILVTIITPRISNRTEDAKLTRARQDLENIQGAQEKAVVDFDFIVRLHVLDDIPLLTDGFPPRAPANFVPGNTVDSIIDSTIVGNANMFGIPEQIFLRPRVSSFTPGDIQLDGTEAQIVLSQIRFSDSESAFGTRRWAGPYLTYQVDQNHPNGDDNTRKTYIGDDPWGNDYLLFVPAGLILEPEGIIVQTASKADLVNAFAPGAGSGLSTTQYSTTVFDRPTVLSLGPNGLPGDGTTAANDGFGRGDDLYRQF